MDGLSAGIALISSLYLAIVYLSQHALGNVTVLLILKGIGRFLLLIFIQRVFSWATPVVCS